MPIRAFFVSNIASMKITILEVGEVPKPLQAQFKSYPDMFIDMFAQTDAAFEFDVAHIAAGDPFPRLDEVEALLIPGSAAGVYDELEWMEPLRQFIRDAYALSIPMVGVCFGHQIIADALGGGVRKSEKGWGIGRHVYDFVQTPDFAKGLGPNIAIAASHQDQVITPPDAAEIFLASEFTPNAGLIYKNAVTLSLQPHPEFKSDYMMALAESRRGTALTDAQVDAVSKSLHLPLEGLGFAMAITQFLNSVG